MNQQLRSALRDAVLNAIEEVGIETFKKTSFFMSASRIQDVAAKAA